MKPQIFLTLDFFNYMFQQGQFEVVDGYLKHVMELPSGATTRLESGYTLNELSTLVVAITKVCDRLRNHFEDDHYQDGLDIVDVKAKKFKND